MVGYAINAKEMKIICWNIFSFQKSANQQKFKSQLFVFTIMKIVITSFVFIRKLVTFDAAKLKMPIFLIYLESSKPFEETAQTKYD